MNTEIIAIDPCPHPEITVEVYLMASSDYTVYCKACRRKIIIPLATIEQGEKDSFIGIVGEVFGEAVAQRLFPHF